MKNKLVWFVVFVAMFLIISVILQFFKEGIIDPWRLLATATGIAIAFFINIAPKKPIVLWIGLLLSALSMPIILVGIVLLILSIFSIHPTGASMLGVYVLGIVIILYLAKRFGVKYFFADPVMDERMVLHYAWSGSLSFIFLNFLIIGAIIQPWIALDQLGLWIGVLSAGLLFWFASLVLLEMKK
jgi:hypothetical protein